MEENVGIEGKPKKESKFWDVFGKVSAVIFTLGTIIGIWVALPKNEVSVKVIGNHTEYQIAPQIHDTIVSVKNSEKEDVIKDKLMEILKKGNYEEYEIDHISYQLSSGLDKAWNYFDIENTRLFNEYIVVYIENNGKIAINDFELKMPTSGKYVIINPDNIMSEGQPNSIVNVGKINPSNLYKVYFWTSTFLEYGNRYFYSYDKGTGEIQFPTKVYGFGAKIINNLRTIIFIVIFLILGFIGIILINVNNIKKGDGNSHELNGDVLIQDQSKLVNKENHIDK